LLFIKNNSFNVHFIVIIVYVFLMTNIHLVTSNIVNI
jgi:hypothetical protein